VLMFGTDQRITSGPAATTAAFKGRIHGCTRTIRGNVRFFFLAPRAPSIHGTNIPDCFRRAAGYVDRILHGAKPGDLPIDEPAVFDFVVNLRAARAIGVAISPDFLSSANEIIE
jgi:hypothetical protein